MSDVQVVVVGPKTVGIVHPSKIYGALAAGRPILVIGPKDSPAARIVEENDLGWVVGNDDIRGLERALAEIEDVPDEVLRARGQRAWQLAKSCYSRKNLIERFVALVDVQ
jgi:glycosyltransferase involved in cell wall biosynthesis